jgi:regulator of extracellular matrix RemA (YlzA/DUF370 family)
MTQTAFFPALAALGLLAACAADLPAASLPVFDPPQITRDAEGQCFGRDTIPALVETQTAQVLATPETLAADGSVATPAVYATSTRQVIVRERQEVLFETVCPETMTPAFVAALQRALKARGYYDGTISGVLDAPTAAAVQALQRQDSHDSPLLDIRTARALGLVALSAAQLAEG